MAGAMTVTLRTGEGTPYAVFSSFAAQEAGLGVVLPAPRTLPPVPPDVTTP
jgi:hypothetical protein